MSQIKNPDSTLIRRFDYLLCMNHNVVVELGDEAIHINEFCEKGNYDCQFLGQYFNIKKPVNRLSRDVSIKLVRQIKEKENIVRWERDHENKIKRKVRDQENYQRQLPIGDGILNLKGVKL